MYYFPNSEPVCCSMFSSNCYFLTCTQISQETCLVFPSLSEFSSLLWSTQSKALAQSMRQMFFCNSLAFSMIQWMLATPAFLSPAWTSGSSWFTYCWSPAWRIFEHYFASVWDECSCVVAWTFFGIAFLWDWNENWPFPVLWPLLSFPNFLAYWV